jgi:mannose-1-phosphate guanylyltransferase
MRAMILAAGLGTRMAPLSQIMPKPALPILDEPMILGMIRSLARQGVDLVVVNTHAHPHRLEEALQGAPIPVVVSAEPSLLGSAGGIRAARRHLEPAGPFVVLNADMRIELDLPALSRAHQHAGALATLLLRDDPRKQRFGTIGYLGTGDTQRVCRITDRIRTDAESGSGLFTGVQMMDPDIFEAFPASAESHLMSDVYVPLLRSGRKLAASLQRGDAIWWPVGTPAELLDANLRSLRERAEHGEALLIHPSARIHGQIRGPAWIGEGAEIASGASLGPDVVVGAHTLVPDGFRASEMLFLSSSRPPLGDPLKRAIAFDQEVWRDA